MTTSLYQSDRVIEMNPAKVQPEAWQGWEKWQGWRVFVNSNPAIQPCHANPAMAGFKSWQGWRFLAGLGLFVHANPAIQPCQNVTCPLLHRGGTSADGGRMRRLPPDPGYPAVSPRYRCCPDCGELQPPGAMRVFVPPERQGALRRQCIFCGLWADGWDFIGDDGISAEVAA